MLNQVILLGRITQDISLNIIGSKKVVNLQIAIPRNFKNENGEYETDFVTVEIWGSIAEAVNTYCKKGDLISIRAAIRGSNGKHKIVAEKITFLQSKKD